MKTIFLDFDGVLFDTVLESYLLARYAYYDIDPLKNINENEYKLFHSVRYLITDSWHYFYIMQLINNGTNLKTFSNEYKKALLNRNIEKDNAFNVKFQEKRKDLIKNYFEFWNKLDKPYPFFEQIKTIKNQYDILIISTKNEEAIYRHCIDYDFRISQEKIIGKTKLKKYGSKKIFIADYIRKHNIQNAIFIDDAIKTINECSEIPNLKSCCANWGYVENKNIGLSEKEILKIIKE